MGKFWATLEGMMPQIEPDRPFKWEVLTTARHKERQIQAFLISLRGSFTLFELARNPHTASASSVLTRHK